MKLLLAQFLSDKSLPQVKTGPMTVNKVLTITFMVIGAVAFLMVVIAGFRIVVSSGESNRIAEARRQLVYALIGLVVAASAATLVNFVLGHAG